MAAVSPPIMGTLGCMSSDSDAVVKFSDSIIKMLLSARALKGFSPSFHSNAVALAEGHLCITECGSVNNSCYALFCLENLRLVSRVAVPQYWPLVFER